MSGEFNLVALLSVQTHKHKHKHKDLAYLKARNEEGEEEVEFLLLHKSKRAATT